MRSATKANASHDFRIMLDPKNIEAVWASHVKDCARCKFVVIDQPVTLENCCAEGSRFLKVILEKNAAPELARKRKAEREQVKASRDEFFATAAQMKAAMKYK
jgi:hypothetical protein